MSLPTPIYAAARVRALDRAAIEQYHIPGLCLMERAGQALFAQLQQRWAPSSLAVVCGLGNNAGDAYVVARLAHLAGLQVNVWQLGDPQTLRGEAFTAYQQLQAVGVVAQAFDALRLSESEVIVDGLFGTGLDRPVTDEWAVAINAINQQSAPVIAVDIPSGLQADTGQVLGVAVQAQVTITFIGLKLGLFTGQGATYCGEVLFDDLQVPDAVYHAVPTLAQRVDGDCLKALKPRSRAAHKGDHGHVLLLGGDAGMSGAILLAGQAAARVGAGKISIATHPSHAAHLNLAQPELMCRGVSAPSDLVDLLAQADVIAIGPGLGQSDWAWMLFNAVIQQPKPLIVDADALNLLAKAPMKLAQAVLTPHPGEAARLLERNTAQIQADRLNAVRQLQDKFASVCVLKGAGSLIVDQHGQVSVCNAGNPGMASGGMGDLLTGVIAGLAAQGASLAQAAQWGVCLQATAGDKAAQDGGERGLLASDLLPWIRRLANALT